LIEDQYGKGSATKIAVSGASDYIVVPVGSSKVEKLVEVKGCHQKKWYPHPREKIQIQGAIRWCNDRGIPFELWIKYPRKGWQIKLPEDLKRYTGDTNGS